MKRRIFTSLAAAAAVTASVLITSSAAAAAPDATPALSATNTAPRSTGVTPNASLPAASQVDATKFHVVATLRGVGKQVYDCVGATWTFREPVAGLLTPPAIPAGIHGAVQRVAGEGPFWSNFDGSKVVAKPVPKEDQVASPAGSSNINWLKATTARTAGTGVFSKVAFIQRIDTKGGVAPVGGCGTAPATVARDYTTIYVFWAPKTP